MNLFCETRCAPGKTLAHMYSIRLLTGFWLLASVLFLSNPASAQYYILGRGLDDNEQPYAHALAELSGPDYAEKQIMNEYGVFRFENLKPGAYELVIITGYGMRRKKIDLRGSIDITLHIPRNIEIDEINVVANKASDNEAVTHTNITSAELRKRNFGQDMPYLLENTPSVVTTSDAGHGIGYTGLRIRGTDPTRINVTFNGVPVNDAETHNVFWVDLPDIASSVTNIQIQRGIGWSQPGTGDLGGSVHINTLGFNYEPYAHVLAGIGSFDSRRLTAGGGTGLINGRFTVDGRASYITSDGYIDRAESKLWSVYGSAGYHHDETHIRLVYTHGDEQTYQAWNGVPAQFIHDPVLRRFNTAGAEKPGEPYDNEIDDYRQSHYQLHIDQAVLPFARWRGVLHYTRGLGYFEQYKADQLSASYGLDLEDTTDLVRQLWLDNHFYGFLSTLQFGSPESRYLIIGGGWNSFVGDNYDLVTWVESVGHLFSPHQLNFNDAIKNDGNVFARSNMRLSSKLDMTVDVQGRFIRYRYKGNYRNGLVADEDVRYSFFNPKVGLHYQIKDHSGLFLLTGIVHKEPNRDDHITSTPSSRPSPERLWDTELGYRLKRERLSVELAGYSMQYKDQLILTGRVNDVGEYTRVNVDESYRMGVEGIFRVQPTNRLDLELQATLSRNKITSFDEYIDNWSTGEQEVIAYRNADIAFSPSVLINLNGGYSVISSEKQKLSVTLGSRYVGKQFADNTGREAAALDAYWVSDMGLHWSLFGKRVKELRIAVFMRNVLDSRYSSNAWTYRFRSPDYNPVPDDPYAVSEGSGIYSLKGYFPQAGRNLYIQAGITF
jgi:iron complex outermembrane receptor protein